MHAKRQLYKGELKFAMALGPHDPPSSCFKPVKLQEPSN